MASRPIEPWRDSGPDGADGGGAGGDSGGGWRGMLTRAFGPGAGFMEWAIPLFTLAGIRVRLHVLFILVEGSLLVQGIYEGYATQAILRPLTIFTLVLIHEFGHCLACRWRGGDADHILLWPLGGLATCNPPHTWKDSLITTLGGPGTHVLMWPILAGGVLATGASPSALLFNPLNPWPAWAVIPDPAFWKLLVWSLYTTNIWLFLFNMLLPMFPMDAGRVVQEVLWRSMGWKRSMGIACNLGLFAAMTVGVLAIFSRQQQLLFIAFFSGMECFKQKQRLAMMEIGDEPTPFEFEESVRMRPDELERQERKASQAEAEARKRAEEAQREQEEVDRILAKIGATGMGSLTRAEKKVLSNATAKKRGGA